MWERARALDLESPEFKSHPYQLATERLRVRNCISLSLHFHIWKIGKRPIYVTELLCNMNSEPFNAGQASKAGYSGARLWLCAHDGMAQWEGRGGHPGNPALPSDPLSRSQTSEHCPGPRGLRWAPARHGQRYRSVPNEFTSGQEGLAPRMWFLG